MFQQQLDSFTRYKSETLFSTLFHATYPGPLRKELGWLRTSACSNFSPIKKAKISDLICWNLGSDCESFMEQKIKIYFR